MGLCTPGLSLLLILLLSRLDVFLLFLSFFPNPLPKDKRQQATSSYLKALEYDHWDLQF